MMFKVLIVSTLNTSSGASVTQSIVVFNSIEAAKHAVSSVEYFQANSITSCLRVTAILL